MVTLDQRNFMTNGQIRRKSMSVDRKVHYIVLYYMYRCQSIVNLIWGIRTVGKN